MCVCTYIHTYLYVYVYTVYVQFDVCAAMCGGTDKTFWSIVVRVDGVH